MSKFTWGRVIEKFEYDMDGRALQVVKFHPWKCSGSTVLTGQPDLEDICYHCEELHQSFDSLDALLIAWIAEKRLGLNQHALVSGMCRALGITGAPA